MTPMKFQYHPGCQVCAEDRERERAANATWEAERIALPPADEPLVLEMDLDAALEGGAVLTQAPGPCYACAPFKCVPSAHRDTGGGE